MYREQIIRMVAGLLVLIGVILALVWSLWWLLLPGFVGFNLFQSSLTRFCLLDIILKKAGFKDPLDEYKARQQAGEGEPPAPEGP